MDEEAQLICRPCKKPRRAPKLYPWCDARYRCAICPGGLGRDRRGFTRGTRVPCENPAEHLTMVTTSASSFFKMSGSHQSICSASRYREHSRLLSRVCIISRVPRHHQAQLRKCVLRVGRSREPQRFQPQPADLAHHLGTYLVSVVHGRRARYHALSRLRVRAQHRHRRQLGVSRARHVTGHRE